MFDACDVGDDACDGGDDDCDDDATTVKHGRKAHQPNTCAQEHM